MGVLTKHLYEEPIPPSELVPPVDLPRPVESIILKAISKKPEKRFQTMTSLREDLRKVMAGETPECFYEDIRNSTLPPSPAEVVGAALPRDTALQTDDTPAPPPRRSRLAIYMGGGALLIALALGMWLFQGSGIEEAYIDPKGKASAGDLPSPDAVPVSPPSQGGASSDNADEGPPEITLNSKPAGATLYKDGIKVGTLPLKVPRPIKLKERAVYALKREGFQDLEVTLTSKTQESFEVEMIPAKPVVRPEKRPKRDDQKSQSSGGAKKEGGSIKKKKKAKKKKRQHLGGDIVDPWG
jgi:serine/threonine-protein kinase